MATPLAYIEGKYEILEKLSEGGMGAIYKVRHRLLDEVRVIKVMQPQHEQDEGLRTRFLREARMAVKLRHPGIAQMYDFAVDDSGNAFIVMEFIDGITLQELLERIGPPSVGLTLEVACQALSALGYLHRKGIIHRDIAPDNVMVGRDDLGRPHAKLIDLGIAKVLKGESGLTITGMFVGKLRYSSPEQFRTEPGITLDERSDIYSFGVVLYELLTGRHPIKGTSPQALIAGHLIHPPADFSSTDPTARVPDDLRAAVLKSMAKRQEDRFVSADEFARALGVVRARFPIPAGEFDRALDLPVMPTQRIVIPRPGSTQERLDEQFRMVPTPAPPSLTPPPAPPPAVPGSAVAGGSAASVEADAQAARVAAAGEVRREVAAGRLDVAAQRLKAAIARWGGEDGLAELRDQIEEARLQRREAEVALLVTEGRSLAAAGRHHEALLRLRRAVGEAPGNREAAALLAELEATVNAAGPPTAPALAVTPPVVPPGPAVAEAAPRPQGRPATAPPRPAAAKRPHRYLLVAGIVLGALLVTWLAVLAVKTRSSGRQAAVQPAPTATAAVAPTATPVGQVAMSLQAAQAALEAGDLAAAAASLDTVGAAGAAALTPEQAALFASLRQRLAGARRGLFVRDLERGLAAANPDLLQRALSGVSDAEVREIARTPKLQDEITTARKVVESNQALAKGVRENDPLRVVQEATVLLGLMPRANRAAAIREQAAATIEAEAEALIKGGQYAAAGASLEALRGVWPERPGLSEKIANVRSAHAAEQQFSAALAEAAKAGQTGRPDRGLVILNGVSPTGTWEESFAAARRKLQAELAELDKQPPVVEIPRDFKFEYEKGKPVTVPVKVTDDFEVKSVAAYGRVEGEGAYVPLPVVGAGGSRYGIEVAPSFHRNETVEFYVVASDVSGHATMLGTKDAPIRLKRKRWLF
ncbi:MAG: protein kinase domain-containing protein [Acidobacteriota bacterium]